MSFSRKLRFWFCKHERIGYHTFYKPINRAWVTCADCEGINREGRWELPITPLDEFRRKPYFRIPKRLRHEISKN